MGKPKARGNGQGTAIKRGKKWEARVVIGWKPNADNTKLLPIIKTKCGFDTKRAALAYCPTLKGSVVRPSKAPTLEYYWNIYESSEYQNLSDSKKTAYKIAWDRLAPLKYKAVDAISVGDLRDIVSSTTKTYYPARDIKQVLTHLFKLAGADRWVDKTLPSYIVLPQNDEKEREPFTEDEQKAIWKVFEKGNKWAGAILVMIATGMMTGEIRRLKPEMIDIDNRCIRGVGLKTKVRKEATIYLATDIVPVILYALNDKEPLWYVTKDTFYKHYYSVLEEAGCRKLSPYSCRHTTATRLAISELVAPQTIKKVMRWSSTKMLDRYAHSADEDAREAVELMNRKKESNA